MKDWFAACGNNCGRCPSFKGNLKTGLDRERCSDGWHKYLGIRLKPEKLKRCVGCPTPLKGNPVRYLNCYVRRCATKNGVPTCAHCSEFPNCEDVGTVSLPVDYRRRVEEQQGSPVPEVDFRSFIEVYEGKKHLEEIRAALKPGDILAAKKPSVRAPKIVAFPEALSVSAGRGTTYEELHRLLSSILALEGGTYARHESIKRERKYMIELLWAFGRFGELEREGGTHLVIEAKLYAQSRIESNLRRVRRYLSDLETLGAHCELVVLDEKEWLTGMGYLRSQGWHLILKFDKSFGGKAGLEALQRYTTALHKEYGSKAFGHFQKADFNVLAT
jgi:hypothetical protein